MGTEESTLVGKVASVSGGIVRVRLRGDTPSSLVMVEGQSYRIGQVGAFFRIPLGYTQLYAICTQVGADAAPAHAQRPQDLLEDDSDWQQDVFRWMTIVLFGEAVGAEFERGVGQYPTIDDAVHLVTTRDLQIIYGRDRESSAISVGNIAASGGIPASLEVAPLVTRHSAIVGSTGSGKSNLVVVLLESLAAGHFPSCRAIVIDPHGEYATALGDKAHAFGINPKETAGERSLSIPYWALPFDELREIAFGGLQPATEAAIREMVLDRKKEAAQYLSRRPPSEALTADSPVPFSLKKLWFDLEDFERRTFKDASDQTDKTIYPLDAEGDADQLRPNAYPAASPYNQKPYYNKLRRNIGRQLAFLRSRLRDSQFNFLFNPGNGLTPALDGKVDRDLDTVVAGWIGHDRPISVFDVSRVPSEILPTMVGVMLRVIYDALFWAADLPIGGKSQPLLIILEEAHRFLPEGSDTPANRILATIAKEGRKYGVGLMLVTQRPTEIDQTVLSQLGTLLALRTTNSADRTRVSSTLPDDLGGLVDLLPALRTGEALFVGDAIPIPSRVRIRLAMKKPVGDDPNLPQAWQQPDRPDPALYAKAIASWRARTTSLSKDDQEESEGGTASA